MVWNGLHVPTVAGVAPFYRELLGWRPRTSLEAGLAATADWYRRELEAGRLALDD